MKPFSHRIAQAAIIVSTIVLFPLTIAFLLYLKVREHFDLDCP